MTAFEAQDVYGEPSARDAASQPVTTDETTVESGRPATPLAVRALAELAGSFLVCFALYAIGSFGTSIYGANMAFIAVGTALAYAGVTMLLSGVSDAQLNPAVTLASVLVSRTPAIDGVAYVVAQVVGAIGAGAVLRFMLPTSSSIAEKVWLTPAVNGYAEGSVSYSTVNSVGISFGITMAIVVEVVASLIIVGTSLRRFASSTSGTAAMGVAYGVGAAITYPITGAALNPARATGIALFAQGQGLTVEPLGQLWVFWVCPVLAAAVVSLAMIVAQMAQSAKHKRTAAPDDAAVAGDAAETAGASQDGETGFEGSDEHVYGEVAGQQADAQSDADEGVERH
ncbi:aquaporin [Bifidobacterium amazonense]|uniref:Aquaporin n=1 Tax=Bifidobacterium amazonense TaxID=2809027 RepID=A0ABS9VSX2_9BIFI|nr:aquaporin [Bifidobacterium amazonense]MCH9275021.1 aquaporin [Bifidobacterium amazonense]